MYAGFLCFCFYLSGENKTKVGLCSQRVPWKLVELEDETPVCAEIPMLSDICDDHKWTLSSKLGLFYSYSCGFVQY